MKLALKAGLPGAPRGTRTPDTLFRRQMLYPLSYGCITPILPYCVNHAPNHKHDIITTTPYLILLQGDGPESPVSLDLTFTHIFLEWLVRPVATDGIVKQSKTA